MYALTSEITIGGRRFTGVHEVKVRRSIHTLGATATVKVPVTAVLRRKGTPPTRVETAQEVRAGDRVEIRLGYDGRLHTEFRGYVRQLNLRTPLEIVCEDEFHTTRYRSVTLQGKTTLDAVLRACGLDIGYAVPLTIAAFPADNKPVAWVLGQLGSRYGLCIWFDLDGKVHAANPDKLVRERVRYRLRQNVAKDDDLRYRHAADSKVRIRAVCILRSGEQVEAAAGPAEGAEKKLYFYDVEQRSELAALAEAELARWSYDGYEGKITTFLEPYAAPCMVARIEDEVYPERSGDYLIESVETMFGTGGGRRTVEIGRKL